MMPMVSLLWGSGTGTNKASNSVSLGNRNHITTEDTFVLGSGINTTGTGRSLASIDSTVANSVYLGKDSSAMVTKMLMQRSIKHCWIPMSRGKPQQVVWQ